MIESAIGELAIVVDTTSACQASALPEWACPGTTDIQDMGL